MSVAPPSPSITLSPGTAYPGDKVLLIARGFDGGEVVDYSWPDIAFSDVLHADDSGVINVIITIAPDRLPNHYRVRLRGRITGLTLDTVIVVLPKVDITTPTTSIPPTNPAPGYHFTLTAVDGSKAKWSLGGDDFVKLYARKDSSVLIGAETLQPYGPYNTLDQVLTWLNQHGISGTPGPAPEPVPQPPPIGGTSNTPDNIVVNVPEIKIPNITIPGFDELMKGFKEQVIDGLVQGFQKSFIMDANTIIEKKLNDLRIEREFIKRAQAEGLITIPAETITAESAPSGK